MNDLTTYPNGYSVVSTYGDVLPVRRIRLAGEREIDYELLNRILILFDRDKPHKQACMDIRKIASMVLSNKSYTSSIINTCFNINFNRFMNFYRVKDACYHIMSEDNVPVTLLCEDMGFRSFSAFSDAFKWYTRGYTPYRWQQNMAMAKIPSEIMSDLKTQEVGYDKVDKEQVF